MTRRAIRGLVASLALLAAAGLAGCSRAAEPDATDRPSGSAGNRLTVRFLDLVNLDVRDVPLLMAFDELATEGYVVEKRYLSDSALMTDMLARGDADIAMINNQTAWAAIAKGADIRTVGQFTGPTTVVAARDPVRSCGDLNGRPVGVATTSGLNPMLLKLYMDRRCPGTEPQWLVLRDSSSRVAAIEAGRIDAAVMPGEELLKLQAQSRAPLHTVMSFADEFPNVRVDGLQVRRRFALEHPDAVKAFLRAQIRAHRQVIANPQILFTQSVARLALDEAIARTIADSHLQMRLWDPDGGPTAESIQSTLDLVIRSHGLPPGVTMAQVADLSFVNAVLDEIGRAQQGGVQIGRRDSR